MLWTLLVLGLCIGSQHAGVSWDEVTYFDFSDHVRAWWRSGAPLDAQGLASAWDFDRYRNPHPPLMRAASALTAAASGLPFPTNYRLASIALCAGLLTLVFALLRSTLGAFGSVLAVAAIILQPRVYGDALNATTDAPVALVFSALCLLAWRIVHLERHARGPLRVVLFATYGVAAAIKFTGLLALGPVGLYFLWKRAWREVAWAALAVAWALCFLVLTSPGYWHAPLVGLVDYLSYPFQRSSIPISTWYFGQAYPFYVPWHYFDVMTAVTLPMLVLVALFLVALIHPAYRSLRTALCFPLGFWLVLAHLPNTPRHDGVRQFLAVMPLLGILSVLVYLSVIERACARVPAQRARSWERLALSAALAGFALSFAPWVHLPLSSYNALAGGLAGAEALGLQTTYFLEAITPDFLAQMNKLLRSGDTVMLLPPWPELLRRYQAEGMLRSDVTVIDDMRARPRYLLLVRRRGVVNDQAFLGLPALIETSQDDVVLAKLGELRELAR